MVLVAAAGLGSHWGSREELLHPRDSHGRFRSKWKMAEGVVDKIMSFLDRFDPYTFPDDRAAADYGLARKSQKAKGDSKAGGVVRRFMRDYAATQQNLRAGRMSPGVEDFDEVKEPLPNDLILSRVVGPEAFGLTPETLAQIEEYTGKLVADKGYSSTNMGTPMGYGPGKILVTIAAPAGTQAMFPSGREVILDRDTPLRVTKVDPDGQGGFYVLAVAEPGTGEKTRRLGGRAPAVTPASKTDVTEARPSQQPPTATTPAPAPVAQAPAVPAPAPVQTGQPGRPGAPPVPRNEPVISESVGGTPETPQTPSAEGPGVPGEQPTPAAPSNFRQAVLDARVPAPSPGKRRTMWNQVYMPVAGGRKDPADAIRELDADIAFLEGEKANNVTVGREDAHLDGDIESFQKLRDLIKEHFGLGTREEEATTPTPEAPKRRRGGGGNLRNVESEEKAAIRKEQRQRGVRQEAPAKKVAEPVQIPGPHEEARRVIDQAGGGEPKTDMGKTAVNLFTDQVARKKISRKKAGQRLRDFADSDIAGEDADLIRRVADVIDPPKMATKAAVKKAAPAPVPVKRATPQAAAPDVQRRALADIKAAPDMESRAGAEAVRDARFKVEAGGDPAEVAADLRRRAASIKRRPMTNDDVLTGRVQRDPDSLKSMRDADVRNLNDLADNLSPRGARKAAAEKAAPEPRTPGQPGKRAVKQIAPEGALATTPKAEAVAGRKPTLDEIRGMKVAELRAEAKKHDIKISATRKADIAEELARKLDLQPGEGQPGPTTPKDILDRISSFDDPPSREEAHRLLEPLSKPDLVSMARELSIPGAAGKNKADLRQEIVEGTAGRRLDSIATRGFRGVRPGVPELTQAEAKVAAKKSVPVPDLDNDLKTTIPNLRKIAQDEGIEVPKSLRLKAEIQNHLHEQRRNRPAPTTAFKEPDLPEVPEVPATKTAAKKAAQTILVQDDELARIVKENSPEQLRDIARQAGVDVPDDMNDKNLIITEIARHVARQELASRKKTQARATKKVTEALAPASPSVDLEELTRDLDPQLLARAGGGKTLERVREGLLDPKKTPAQVGRDLERDADFILTHGVLQFSDKGERATPGSTERKAENKRMLDSIQAQVDELKKLADRLKKSRRKPARQVSATDKAIRRQQRIDEARQPADFLATIEEVSRKVMPSAGVFDEESRRHLRRELTGRSSKQQNLEMGEELLGALESPDTLQRRLHQLAERHGLTVVGGSADDVVAYDPKIHQALVPVKPGDKVAVVKPGYSFKDPVTGEDIQLSRAIVLRADPPKPVKRLAHVTDDMGRIVKRERPNADAPIYLPNAGADQGRVHLDSELGSLWADLYADDRLPNSTLNELAHVGEGVGLSSTDLADAIKVLRRMAAEAPDDMIRDRIERAIDNLDSPRVQVPDLPGVPDSVMRYLRQLERIPTMRIREGRVGATGLRGESILDKVIALLRKINDGEISPFEAERRLRERHVHESFDGGVTSWSLAERLFTPTLSRWDPTAKEGKGDFVSEPNPQWPAIRDWIRNARKNRSN